MKLKYDFVTTKIDDEYMAVPVGKNSDEFKAVLKLNESASTILELLKEDLTKEELVKKLSDVYDGDVSKDIDDFLAVLDKNNLLIK